jgi:hypothetical protein
MQTATRHGDYRQTRYGLWSGIDDGGEVVTREKSVLVCVFAAGVANALHGCGQPEQEPEAGVVGSGVRDAGRPEVAVVAEMARGPRRVQVRLRATPDDAELWLDGARVTNPYDEEREASAETHRVEARLRGYTPIIFETPGSAVALRYEFRLERAIVRAVRSEPRAPEQPGGLVGAGLQTPGGGQSQ